MTAKPVIILDMDETLLHTAEEDLYSDLDEFDSIPRPGLAEFINIVSSMGDVWVLSAGSPEYIPIALQNVGILNRIKGWRSSQLVNRLDRDVIKGRPWVLVDDRPHTSPLTQRKLYQCGSGGRGDGHLIVVAPFTGQRGDRALHSLPALIQAALTLQAARGEP